MGGTSKFLILRTLSLIPTIFGIILVTFILSRIVPGNPALILIGPEVNGTELKVLEAELGLNKPLYVQFFIYLWQLIHFNLGYSYLLGQSVNYEVALRFPASLELGLASMIISLPIAVVTGIYAALRVNRAGDHASRVLSLLGISMPVFWIEIVMILIFYTYLGIAPAPFGQLSSNLTPPVRITGMEILDSLLELNFVDFFNATWHIILPAVGLSLASIATLSRVIRSSMLDVLNRDFMRTSVAIGLPKRVIVNKYALRNALLPGITVAAIQAGAIISGVVLTETVFSWQGLGLYAVQAIDQLDYPSVMAVVLISGLLFAFFNFLADIIYAWVDPRVRL